MTCDHSFCMAKSVLARDMDGEGIGVHLLWKSRTPEHPKGYSRDQCRNRPLVLFEQRCCRIPDQGPGSLGEGGALKGADRAEAG